MSKSAAASAVSRDQQVEAIMAQLRAPRDGRSFIDRVTDVAVDSVADAMDVGSRFIAAGTSAFENAGDAYTIERERQLRRRAEKLLKLAS